MDDWYEVTCDTVEQYGGGWLLRKHYNSSLHEALATLFPGCYHHHIITNYLQMTIAIQTDHTWSGWRFSGRTPPEFWNNKDNQKQWIQHLANQLNIKQLEDWYKYALM